MSEKRAILMIILVVIGMNLIFLPILSKPLPLSGYWNWPMIGTTDMISLGYVLPLWLVQLILIAIGVYLLTGSSKNSNTPTKKKIRA